MNNQFFLGLLLGLLLMNLWDRGMIEVKCENSKMLINARHIKWVDYNELIRAIDSDE